MELMGWEGKQTRISNYENNKRMPHLTELPKLADVLGLPLVPLLLAAAGLPMDDQDKADLADHYSFIPMFSVEAAAGHSSGVEFEAVSKTLAYRNDWLSSHGLYPRACRVINVRGDSMYPTIGDGDAILVDTSDRQIADGRIYVFRHDEGPRVKRLVSRLDGGYDAVSDNPDKSRYRSEPLTPGMDVAMIGRVVHRSGLV